ncbi:MAG TPA: hypothetical protein VF773_02165 [Verrucomicrobiae bacterium]
MAIDSDILNISGELIPEIGPELEKLLERGKTKRTKILDPAEHPDNARRKPYAVTKVSIKFDDERSLRKCVRLLRWSDERLRARPDQLVMWEWNITHREGMSIYFGVAWYDREFFEKRKNAFMEPSHTGYFSMFGAKAEDFKMEHVIKGKN